MQFKIDENLPTELAQLLTNAGHDAKTVHFQKLQGTKDSSLIKICKKENRSLITLDTDFANIKSYPPENFQGIIVLRLSNQAKVHVMKIFESVISLLSKEPLHNHLWIVEETSIRVRGEHAG